MLSPVYAVECEWWQTKVKSHQVKQYERKGFPVSAHPRQEHCREVWKHADQIISTFRDSPPLNWAKEEKFKAWSQKDIQEVLKAYEMLPEWLLGLQKSFHRAEKSSKTAKNPAASDKTTDSVTIYDEFYKRSNKRAIVGHEMAHLLFKRLSPDDIGSFTDLAGWTLKVEGNQVFEVPPAKVLIQDSFVNKEEDFANSVEIFFTDPSRLKNHNQKLFDFFQKRFSK
jgi:hypothetical protein